VSRAWSATVSKDILKSLPDNEIKRQEAIHELIYTEDDYVRDLRILDVVKKEIAPFFFLIFSLVI
jgi:hypothetical protein